jgi:hypothetical protein
MSPPRESRRAGHGSVSGVAAGWHHDSALGDEAATDRGCSPERTSACPCGGTRCASREYRRHLCGPVPGAMRFPHRWPCSGPRRCTCGSSRSTIEPRVAFVKRGVGRAQVREFLAGRARTGAGLSGQPELRGWCGHCRLRNVVWISRPPWCITCWGSRTIAKVSAGPLRRLGSSASPTERTSQRPRRSARAAAFQPPGWVIGGMRCPRWSRARVALQPMADHSTSVPNATSQAARMSCCPRE